MVVSISDLDRQISLLLKCNLITEREVKFICKKAKDILFEEDNVHHVNSPITVIGDLHGQFFDVLEIFKLGGYPPFTNYLFMGDYVDRGYYSVETILLLLAYKVRYPDRMTLIRGNHETRKVTKTYGFFDECLRKYGSANVWNYLMEIFDFMCISAVIDNSIFCVHGGISPEISKIEQVNKIDRIKEAPRDGVQCDLLWSDPDEEISGWKPSPRDAGFLFGIDTVLQFQHLNKIDLIARSHQLVMKGHKFFFNKKLVTIWSAPNYCYRCGNIATIMEVNKGLISMFKSFGSCPTNLRKPIPKKSPPGYFM